MTTSSLPDIVNVFPDPVYASNPRIPLDELNGCNPPGGWMCGWRMRGGIHPKLPIHPTLGLFIIPTFICTRSPGIFNYPAFANNSCCESIHARPFRTRPFTHSLPLSPLPSNAHAHSHPVITDYPYFPPLIPTL